MLYLASFDHVRKNRYPIVWLPGKGLTNGESRGFGRPYLVPPVQGSLFPWDSVVCVSAWLRRSKHRSGGPQRWPHLLVPVVLARARSSLKLEGDTRGASHNRTDSVSSQPIEVLRKISLFRTTLACPLFFVLNINYLYHFFTRLVITQKFISINNATQRKKCNSYSGSKIEDGRNYF